MTLLEEMSQPLFSTQVIQPEEDAFDRLVRIVADFQQRLDDQHEAGAHLGNADAVFHLRDVKRDGTLFLFDGVDNAGREVLVVQHFTQTSLQLVKVKKLKGQPARVGFIGEQP